MFRRFSVYGKNLSLLSTASIENKTGSKENITIGNNCELGCSIYVESGKLQIGDYTTIRHNTEINTVNFISIGNDCIISNNCVIYDNNSHPTSPKARLAMTRSGFHSELWLCRHSDSNHIIIEDNVWIGQRSMILKGREEIVIGRGCIIGAGSVVTKSIPPYAIVAGNPAKIVKYLDNDNQ